MRLVSATNAFAELLKTRVSSDVWNCWSDPRGRLETQRRASRRNRPSHCSRGVLHDVDVSSAEADGRR